MNIGTMIEIHDPADPRIGVFLNQRDAWLKAAHNPAGEHDTPDPAPRGVFMAEGVLVVEHLLTSRFGIESVLVSRNRVRSVAATLARTPEAVPVYVADQPVMDAVVGFAMHRGLLACGRRLPNPDPIELARRCRALILLEDLSNHDNVGSVFRSAAALGGRGVGVLLSPRCCDPLYRKALRVSMGHVLRVPWAVFDEPIGLLNELHSMGFTSIALTPDSSAMTIDESLGLHQDKPVLCLGAEGPGLSESLLEHASQRVRIPMADGVDSLNIAVAAAVCLHRYLTPG